MHLRTAVHVIIVMGPVDLLEIYCHSGSNLDFLVDLLLNLDLDIMMVFACLFECVVIVCVVQAR